MTTAKQVMRIWMVTLVLLGCSACRHFAATCVIENSYLSVTWDDKGGSFSLAETPSGKSFLTGGKLAGEATKAEVTPAKDAVFGAGHRIQVTQSDGSVFSLELYEGFPFLVLRTEIHNGGTAITDFKRLVPATFTLDLGKPASELRTMGTAGLTGPDQHPGSYLFLTLADPPTRRGVVAGWLTEDRASGIIFSSIKDGKVEFKAQLDYGHLHILPGASEKLETLIVGLFDDARLGEEAYADAIHRQYQIQLRPHLAGYCTWYSEVGGLTDKKGGAGCSNEKDLTTLADFAAHELKPYGFSFVQIDDGWQDGRVFNGPRRGFMHAATNGPYPRGMAPVAEMIKSNGLTAGLWFLPFARNHQDPEYQSRQSWFMRRLDGRPYETVWGGTSLDLTHPEVQSHLAQLARTIHGWGYDYFKMDGLWTGSVTEQIYVNDGYKDDDIGNYQPFHDPMKTSIESMRDGLKILRKGAGADVFFSGCCTSQNMRSLAGSIGLVDSMRIGPDNGFGWQDYRKETMHFDGGGIITGPIRGNRLYFLNGRVWWNDPDPSYVRASVKLNHARLLASWMALSGMFSLNSDWLPGLPLERLDILKRCLLSHEAIARPVDYFDSPMPSIWLVTDTNRSVRRDALGLYNWDSKARTIGYDSAKAGLDAAKSYFAFDFWSGLPLPAFKGVFNFDVPAESCRVIAVRAAEGHPILVSTSRHVTQGMVDVADEKWDFANCTLSGVSQLVANDPYELRIAGLNDESRKWNLSAASISSRDLANGVVITPETARACDDGWVRILLESKNSRAVAWQVKFASGN